MIKNINGVGSPASSELRSQRNDQANRERVANDSGPRANSAIDNSGNKDKVELSSQAHTLKSLENKLQSLPEVNEDHVAKIKAAIESGDFAVNPQRLADKMLAADGLFS